MKWSSFIIIVFVVLIISAFFFMGIQASLFQVNIDNVKITIGESTRFSPEGIQAAVDEVIKQFPKLMSYCELTDIWYDEKESDIEIMRGQGVLRGVKKENVIILHCNFSTTARSVNAGFTPDTQYNGWKWILVRSSKYTKWRIADKGYG